MYHKCQKNTCPHVAFLFPKIKSCVEGSNITQPGKKLAAKLNTNLSSIHRTCMDGRRKTNSRQLLRPPALTSNKILFKERKSTPLIWRSGTVVVYLSSTQGPGFSFHHWEERGRFVPLSPHRSNRFPDVFHTLLETITRHLLFVLIV